MLLADNIPEKARTSYLALKAVVKTHINRVFDGNGYAHKIPSYALKTILFFEMEKIEESYWTREDIEEEFFWTLFNSLHQRVSEKRCPHYWIESLDLFSDMENEDFLFIEGKLKKIEEQPVKHIASEWLEWNRYMRKNCCESCIEQAHEERYVINNDVEPLKICCCPIPCDYDNDVDGQSSTDLEDGRWKIPYDDQAVQVY